jgi:uncharacterized membrane protein HdeD (DUF308 family)
MFKKARMALALVATDTRFHPRFPLAARKASTVTDEWLLVLTGIASVGFGVLLFVAPGPGSVVLASRIGIYLVVFGILMLVLALRLRSWDRSGHPS